MSVRDLFGTVKNKRKQNIKIPKNPILFGVHLYLFFKIYHQEIELAATFQNAKQINCAAPLSNINTPSHPAIQNKVNLGKPAGGMHRGSGAYIPFFAIFTEEIAHLKSRYPAQRGASIRN